MLFLKLFKFQILSLVDAMLKTSINCKHAFGNWHRRRSGDDIMCLTITSKNLEWVNFIFFRIDRK